MKKRSHEIRSGLVKVRFFSPGGFLVCALAIAVTFVGMEALGLRSSVTALAGANTADGGWLAFGTACLYLLCYLAFAVLAPIFLLGSIFFLVLNLIMGSFHRKRQDP